MTLNIKTLLGLFLGLILISTGCKKGEGDPALSLSSRKARVAGEWTVTAGAGKENTSTWTYADGKKITVNQNSRDTSNTTMDYVFEKDGTFSSVGVVTFSVSFLGQTIASISTSTETGTWNFTGNVGDAKNKSQILLSTLTSNLSTVLTATGETPNTTNTSETYAGTDAPSALYDIYQLKSKEMIIKSSSTATSGTTINTSEEEWTLTAK